MMKLTFVELERNPRILLGALERGEEVLLLRGGKELAIIQPVTSKKKKSSLRKNPAFGMWADRSEMKEPTTYVRKIRQGRFDHL